MPQVIPVEASETLAFTPECFKDVEGAPRFVLRTPTPREKRHQRRLFLEEGLRSHTSEQIRAEILKGLEALWSPEDFEKHAPVLKAYWEAQEDFALQKKDDPKLEWAYDPEIEDACKELVQLVAKAWQPLRVMMADNADSGEMQPVIMAAVMLTGWSGLAVQKQMAGGYITIDCAHQIEDELEKIEKVHGIETGTAWTQLFIEAAKRMYLDEEEAGNSVSPSPSETPPAASSETKTQGEDGMSPASATSKKTRATA